MGKLHQTSKTKHGYKNSKKTKAALRGQVHSSKIKRKKIQVYLGFLFSSPKIPKVGAGKPHSGGFTHSGNSSGAGPGLRPLENSEPTRWKWKKSGQGWEVVEIRVPAAQPCPVKRLLKSSVTPPRGPGARSQHKKTPTNKPKITRKSTSVQSSVLCPCLRLGCHLAPAQGHSGTHRGTLRDTLGSSICK